MEARLRVVHVFYSPCLSLPSWVWMCPAFEPFFFAVALRNSSWTWENPLKARLCMMIPQSGVLAKKSQVHQWSSFFQPTNRWPNRWLQPSPPRLGVAAGVGEFTTNSLRVERCCRGCAAKRQRLGCGVCFVYRSVCDLLSWCHLFGVEYMAKVGVLERFWICGFFWLAGWSLEPRQTKSSSDLFFSRKRNS